MIKLIKSDIDEITLYIVNEKIDCDTIEIHQPAKKEGEWQLLKKFKYNSNKIDYSVKDMNKFNREIDIQQYRVLFKKGEDLIKEAQIFPSNSEEPSWKRGVMKQQRYEFLIKAKKVNGNKLLVFKKIHEKEHCPDCWDDDLQSSNNTSCPTCGGVGYIDKYSYPFFTWGGPYVSQPSSYPKGGEDGKDIYNPQYGGNSNITLLPDVPIDIEDLIYVVDNGELGRVINITNTFFSNILLSQSAVISVLPSASREYKAIELDLKEKLKELYGVK